MARPSFESAEQVQAMQEIANTETSETDIDSAQEGAEKPEQIAEPSADDQIKKLKQQLDGLWRKALDQNIEVGSPSFLAVSKERSALREQIRELENKSKTERQTIPAESDTDILRDGAQLIGKQENARYQEAVKDVSAKEEELAKKKLEADAAANTKEQQQIRSREAELAAEQRPTQEGAPDTLALERKQRIEQLRAELATLKAGGKLQEAQPAPAAATRAEQPKDSTGDAQLDAIEAQANQAALDARKSDTTVDIGEFRKVAAEVRERRAEVAAEAKETQAQAEAQADLEKSEQQLIAEKRKRDVAFLKPRLGLLGSSTAVKKAFGRAIGPEEFGITDFDELLTPEGEQKLNNNEYFKAASDGMREMMRTEISKLREKYTDANTQDNITSLEPKNVPSFELRKAA